MLTTPLGSSSARPAADPPGPAMALLGPDGEVEAATAPMAAIVGGSHVVRDTLPAEVRRAVDAAAAAPRTVLGDDGTRWTVTRVGARTVVHARPGITSGGGAVHDDRLAAIVELHQDLAGADFDEDGIVQWLVERSRLLFGDREASLGLVMGDSVVYTNVTRASRESVETRTLLASSVAGLCIRSGGTMVAEDVEQDPRVDLAACRREGARSMVLVPLRHRGRVVGVLNVHSPQPYAFSASDVATVERVGGVVSAAYGHAADLAAKRELVTELERTLAALQDSQVQLQHDAMHDALTGLPNRVLFMDRLRQSLAAQARGGPAVAVLFADVDHFKAVNDSLGHDAGDVLLRAVADRMADCLRATDTAARFGGDEFTALCVGADRPEDVRAVAQRMATCIGQRVALPGGEAFPRVSVGIACGTRGTSPEALLKRADLALYRAKAAGRDRIELDTGT